MISVATTLLALGSQPGGGQVARARTSFSGDTALSFVRAQLAFGPRVPGTEAHRRTGDWIVAQLRARGARVTEQRWTHVTRRGDTLAMRNVLGRLRPELRERVLYVAHWDTRPRADQDPDRAKRRLPVPGANDGASGVAVLLGVAEALRRTPPTVGVDLLFVDGEDYGDFGDPARSPDVLIGSRHFAAHLPEPGYRPRFGVVWDMVGDAHLRIDREAQSVRKAPEVVARVWAAAAALGHARHFSGIDGGSIDDDHRPLLAAGLPVIAVIDLQYGPPDDRGVARPSWHHTTHDTLDKVSARSLQVVGDVAVRLVTEE